MTIRKLALELCRREGRKRQVDIAQMREVLGHLSDMVYGTSWSAIFVALIKNGQKRAIKARRIAKRKRAGRRG